MKIIYKAKALGATNHRGSRIKLTNVETQESKTIDWDYAKYFNEQVISHVTEKLHYAKYKMYFTDKDTNYFIFEGE
jgi:histone deacetylase complex regulatory component SIN3